MTSTKKYHCCIPGCTTYDFLDKFIGLPYETYWREQWLLRIPRKDWVVSASTIACKKHFLKPIDISTEAIKDEEQKKKITLVTTKAAPIITKAIPKSSQIFNDNHHPQSMFELYDRDVLVPKTLVGLADTNTDFMGTYFFLKMLYQKKLQMFLENPWKVFMDMDHTIFYTIDFSETPRILATIRVDKNLHVSVTLAGKTMDPLDLTWVLPVTGKLNRWSQLQLMLSIYGR